MTRQDLAVQAAKEAGGIHLKYFRKPLESTSKNPRDIVTVADTEAEDHIVALIEQHFPDDSILAEEGGATNKSSEYQWIIDPLDATSNFYKGSPDFCVIIALQHNGETIYGVMWFPATQELFIAERGNGATCNGEPLHVSAEDSLANCYGNTQMSSKLDARTATLKLYSVLIFKARNIHVINACVGRLLADVASGRADFHFRFGMNLWDYAAGILLVEEAGGKVTDIEGKPVTPQSNGVLAANGLCYDELLSVVS